MSRSSRTRKKKHIPIKTKRKMILMGFDGAMTYFVRKFAEAGKIPNTAKLIRKGFFSEALPTPPCDTPTNWTTIATGTNTGGHGVAGFYFRIPGESLDYGARDECRGRGQLSSYCKAEYLWDSADGAGKRCLVINYRGGWPAKLRKGIVINGDGRPVHYIASPMRYVSPSLIRTEDQLCPVKLEKADRSENIKSHSPLLKAEIKVESPHLQQSLTLRILVVDSEGKGYDRVLIGKIGELCDKKQLLKVGDWTDWFEEEFKLASGKSGKSTIYYIKVKPKNSLLKGFLRFKLIRLSPDASEFELFRTHVFTTLGWTYPAELGPELLRRLDLGRDFYLSMDRPLVDGDLYWSVTDGRRIGKDLPTFSSDQIQADRLVRIIEYLQKSYGWDLCFFHFHLMDRINHHLLADLCPGYPGYTKFRSRQAFHIYERGYRLIDDFVGELRDRCADEDTLMVYVSDHAALPTWKYVRIAPSLVKKGLLAYKWNQEAQRFLVDWSGTQAFPYIDPLYIWVNLKGRDPEGVVEPQEYDEVRERVIGALLEIRDPETGGCPIALALKKEDARFLFQFGERIGDVVYYLKPPYTMDGPPREHVYHYIHQSEVEPELFEGSEVRPTTRLGHHTFYLPTARFDSFSVSAVLIMNGPGVKEGSETDRLVILSDIAPTVAHLLGISPPAQADGRVLHEVLER